MQCRFSFKHMKTSESLSEYAEQKITEKIQKYSTKPIEAQVTFSVEGHDHKVHCSVKGGDGFNVQVDAACEDMYGSVDLLIDKLDIQLKRQKERLKNHKHSINIRHLEPREHVSKDDCDEIPADADDVIKLEKLRHAGG